MGETVEITSAYVPGALGRVVEMHAIYYARHWGFGPFFEAKVAAEMAEFLNALPHQDARLWCAAASGRIVGSVAIDGRQAVRHGAQLRWFIVDDSARGYGLGRRLLAEALAFAHARAHGRVTLHTFAGLDTARRLYEAAGFRLVEEGDNTTWGNRVIEQRFVLALAGKSRIEYES